MATTVGALLSRVARDLYEPSNLFDGVNPPLWTPAEMLGFVDYAEMDFLRRTGIYKVDASVTLAAGSSRTVARPATALDVERVSFKGVRLRRQTNWDLEREDAAWRSRSGFPRYYHEDHLPIGFLELDRTPDRAGTLRIMADLKPTQLSSPSVAAAYASNLNVGDPFVPYVQWHVLSLALGKDGDAQDLGRAAHAMQRYKLGVALARRLVTGETVLPSLEAV